MNKHENNIGITDIEYTILPDHVLSNPEEKHKVNFVPYASQVPVVKGRSSLKKHVISLITEGEKIIHTAGTVIHVTPENILLLAAGNYLNTERFKKNERIKSIMVFFDDDLLKSAISELKRIPAKDTSTQHVTIQPFALFPKDEYLDNFIDSVQSLIDNNLFTEPLQLTKLNELLIFLYTKHPEQFEHFQNIYSQRPEEERIKHVMEENISHNLSVSELAFLCHMSLPTFKRKFQQIYNESPARWIQIQRLTTAADLLKRKGAKPGDVYLQAGYENHSSFSKAFKRHFGLLPKDY
ncbi:MAG: AraC family transcriptional regulator [Flavipsychrobacter sp.]|nr:AraC family transcriptional regulator [Flavipsychrobacter sp.]